MNVSTGVEYHYKRSLVRSNQKLNTKLRAEMRVLYRARDASGNKLVLGNYVLPALSGDLLQFLMSHLET